jgi:hypothetical protein
MFDPDLPDLLPYRAFTSKTLPELEERVLKALTQGYHPVGGITVQAIGEESCFVQLVCDDWVKAYDGNSPITAYRAVAGDTSRAYCEEVSQLLIAGWQLFGGPSLSVAGGEFRLAQALVR